MKRNVLASFAVVCLSVAVFAQPPKIHLETSEAKAKIQGILSGLESENDPYDMSNRLWDFEMKVLSYRNKGMRYTPETTREITVRLIKVFNRLGDKDIDEANKVRIVEIVGITDNSQEAHDFFHSILENGSERTKKMALFSIWPRGVRGDDIYDKVKSLVDRGRMKRLDSLDPLKRAKPERAIKEIQDYVRTTDDVAEFKGVGQLLSEYDRPELMDVVIDRYPEMKKKWNGYFGDDPARSIKTKLLMKIVEFKEGPQLKSALEMLNRHGTSGEEALPTIKKKLQSKDEITRLAVLEFLLNQVEQGNIKAVKAKPVVESCISAEKEKNTKNKAEEIFKKIESRCKLEWLFRVCCA